jgi:hypothetical protein
VGEPYARLPGQMLGDGPLPALGDLLATIAAFRPDCVAHYLAERELGWAIVAARVP